MKNDSKNVTTPSISKVIPKPYLLINQVIPCFVYISFKIVLANRYCRQVYFCNKR
jgi:hypothetical protein